MAESQQSMDSKPNFQWGMTGSQQSMDSKPEVEHLYVIVIWSPLDTSEAK